MVYLSYGLFGVNF